MKRTYCFISAQFLPTRGGVERYTQGLGKELMARGNRVVIFTSLRSGLQRHEVIDGIEVFRIPSLQLKAGRFPVPLLFFPLHKAEQWIAKNKVDLLVLQTHFYILSLWGAQVGKKLGLKTIGIDHCTGYIFKHGIVGWLGILYEKFCVKELSGISYYGVSKACCKWITKLGMSSKGVLYNSIDIEQVKQVVREDNTDWREVLGIQPKTKIVLYAGRLVPEKGILLLLEAFEKIDIKIDDIVLVIMGDGPIYEQIKKRSSRSIIVLGSQTFEKVLSIMAQADIFCLPTYYPEGMPTSVLEAVATKCCVVTTQAGGSKELIQNEVSGIILNELTADLLKKAIKFVLETDQWREKAEQTAYNVLVERFTWKTTCDKLERIQQELF